MNYSDTPDYRDPAEIIAELKAELKRRPQYDARVLAHAEQIVAALDQDVVAARERLAQEPPSLTPAAVADLSLVGAALLARTPMTPTQFSSTMAEQFSDLPGINMMLLFMASSAELEHRLRTLERERQCHLRRAHAAIHKFELTVASWRLRPRIPAPTFEGNSLPVTHSQ